MLQGQLGHPRTRCSLLSKEWRALWVGAVPLEEAACGRGRVELLAVGVKVTN